MNTIKTRLCISREWISRYRESIDAPRQTMNGILIGPATMPIIFWQEFDIPWLKKDLSYIHGLQKFSYKAPMTEGMMLDCELTLTKVEEKVGRQGMLTFFTHMLRCTCGKEPIVTAETVLIQVGDSSEKTYHS